MPCRICVKYLGGSVVTAAFVLFDLRLKIGSNAHHVFYHFQNNQCFYRPVIYFFLPFYVASSDMSNLRKGSFFLYISNIDSLRSLSANRC